MKFYRQKKEIADQRWQEWVARLQWPYKFPGGPRSTKPCVSVCASPAKFLISSCSYFPEDALVYKWRAPHQQPVCSVEGSPWHVYISVNTEQKYHLEDIQLRTEHVRNPERLTDRELLQCPKCLPSPLSSARRTMNTYLNKGTKVSVQKTNERTPNISSLVSECWMSSANVLL